MKFKTLFGEKTDVVTCPGDELKDEYILKKTENGETLVKTGQTNMYDYIQSHADSVDIHKILERCALVQDYSLLNRQMAEYMDCSEMPTTLADAYNMVVQSQQMFEKMPLSVREAYDNNFVQFIGDFGSANFNSVVGTYLESVKKVEPTVEVQPSISVDGGLS